MGLFDGKTPSERKKMIAAAVLGVLSLVALYMAFGRSFFGGSTTTATTTKASPTPKAAKPPTANDQFKLPNADEIDLNMIVPVVYQPGNTYGAPNAGRNIFAFYEPPPPTPYQTPSPTPTPPPVVPTPTPIPTPVFLANSLTPGSVYAGSKGPVKLDVLGDRFTPNARIYFNQTEMPTSYVSPQQLTTTLTDNMVAQEGPKQILIQTPDGTAYSGPLTMNVMAPPRPTTLQFIGMIGRKRYNNDTAYLLETGKTVPFGARLNDVVAGRFRVIDISASAVILEDVSLGFRHRLAMVQAGSGGPAQPGGFVPYNPAQGGNPRMVPQPPRPDQKRPPNSKDDVDDNDDPPE